MAYSGIEEIIDWASVTRPAVDKVRAFQPLSFLSTHSIICWKVCLETQLFIMSTARYFPKSWVMEMPITSLVCAATTGLV